MTDPRFPIGPYKAPEEITNTIIAQNIEVLENFPKLLSGQLTCLTQEQIATSYRDGGWTVAQVVHHCADSHLNAYIRTKWTLTEKQPTIKPYNEALWADLPDAHEGFPVQTSLEIISGIHARWVFLLRNLDQLSFKKAFFHPENKKIISIAALTCLYAWHSSHHLGHIRLVAEKN